MFKLFNGLFLIGTMMETPGTFRIISTAVEPTSILTLLKEKQQKNNKNIYDVLKYIDLFKCDDFFSFVL